MELLTGKCGAIIIVPIRTVQLHGTCTSLGNSSLDRPDQTLLDVVETNHKSYRHAHDAKHNWSGGALAGLSLN